MMRFVADFSNFLYSVVVGLAVVSRLLAPASSNHTADANRTREHRAARKLTVTTVLDSPYMMMKEKAASLTGNDRFEGYLADILRLVAASLRIDYEICLSTDGNHGEQNADGQWNGIIGQVVRGERDIAAGALAITTARRKAVYFSESFMTMRSAAVLLKPSAPVDTASTSSEHSRRREFYWTDGGGINSDDTSRRRPSINRSHRLTSAMQLIQSTDYEFGMLRGGVAHHQLSTSADPLLRAAWARLQSFWPSAIVSRLPEGLDRVRRNRRFALIVDSPTAEFVTTRRPCDLYATEPFLDAVSYGFAIGRQIAGAGQLQAAINRQLARLRRDSVLQTLYLHWWRSECNDLTEDDRTPVVVRQHAKNISTTLLGRDRQRARQMDSSSSHHVDSISSSSCAERQYTDSSIVVVAVVSAYFVRCHTIP